MSETFATHFGKPSTVSASAPGRLNLIGEHVDYNGGSVLPMATPQRAFVELGARGDDRVRAFSVETAQGEYALGTEQRGLGWLDYVQGITRTLSEYGSRTGGFDLWLHSEVPVGAGLSSSAALEVALLRGLRELWGLALSDLELAILAQRSEREFVGANVGIMDQLASSLGHPDAALLLDTATLKYREVVLPAGLALLVIDSGIKHDLVTGGYNQRREECEAAARALGVEALCSLTSEALPRLAQLGQPLARRARHAITENERVLAAVRAIEAGQLTVLGRLIDASHDSLRDDFEVSLPAIDRMVELARRTPQVLGARLMGGGFGGSVLVLTTSPTPYEQAEGIAQQYADATGEKPRVVLPLRGS